MGVIFCSSRPSIIVSHLRGSLFHNHFPRSLPSNPSTNPKFTILFSIFNYFPIFSPAVAPKLSICAASDHPNFVYPDPDPHFAAAETEKFRKELFKRLSKNKETFGDEVDAVIVVCAEILSDFLHKEYGGPGTLLVEPFTDMLLVLKEKKLPGATVAAREALLWAQSYIDADWDIWTSQQPK